MADNDNQSHASRRLQISAAVVPATDEHELRWRGLQKPSKPEAAMVTGSAGFFQAVRMSLIRFTTEIDDACQVSGTRARTSRKRGCLTVGLVRRGLIEAATIIPTLEPAQRNRRPVRLRRKGAAALLCVCG